MTNKYIFLLTIASIIAIFCLFIILAVWKYIKHNTKVEKIKKIKGNYYFFPRYLSYIFLVISIIFLSRGLITSFFSQLTNNTKTISSNTNIVFVLDVSKSMNSIDIKQGDNLTTRLDFSKQAIKNYISKHPNYKYGLVIFTKQAQAVAPLTKDINTFSTLLEGVDYKNLTEQGTNFEAALKLAIDRFKAYKGKNILVFISDGGDKGDYKGINMKIPSNIKSFVFGVGSKQGGKILLGQDDFGYYKFQKYKGEYVITKLNEENLKKLAKDINGLYFKLDNPYKLGIIDKYFKQTIDLKEFQSSKYKVFLPVIISSFFFILSYVFFFLKRENIFYVKKIITIVLNKSKKKEKTKPKPLHLLDKCNIKLRNGIIHSLYALVSIGIYHFIYLYKRFKLRNCLVYKTQNCCSIKNIRNLIFLGILILILIFSSYGALTDIPKNFSSKGEYLATLLYGIAILFIFITNAIISILYLSIGRKKPAKFYLSLFFGGFLLLVLLSYINPYISLALGFGIYMPIRGGLFAYGFFVDEKIKKVVYGKK